MASRGLPTNPRPRVKSAAASSPHRPPIQNHALPSNPRTGASIVPARRVQDPPYTISQRDHHSNQVHNVSNHRRTPDASPASSISSTSSFWAGGKSSVTSSRTTLPSEEEGNQEQAQKLHLRSGDVQERKRCVILFSLKDTITNSIRRETNDAGGFTWNKVSEAANVFTQEVTKAWTAGLNPLGLSNGYSGADKGDVFKFEIYRHKWQTLNAIVGPQTKSLIWLV